MEYHARYQIVPRVRKTLEDVENSRLPFALPGQQRGRGLGVGDRQQTSNTLKDASSERSTQSGCSTVRDDADDAGLHLFRACRGDGNYSPIPQEAALARVRNQVVCGDQRD